jgi:hypothetical protein
VLDTPTGPIKLLHTVEFEPTTQGTTIHFRYAPPRTRREKELMKVIGPAYGEALTSGIPSLIAQLDAEQAVRDAGRDAEPEVAAPKPGGILSGLEPLVISG